MVRCNQTVVDDKISKMFTAAKVIAILSVISAHTPIRTLAFVANIYAAIGTIGVIVFFIISGYYYKKEPLIVMIKKKAKSIVAPWLILGTVVWLYNRFRSQGEFHFLSWLQWILGYQTYLYYVVVLLTCFLIFYFNRRTAFLIFTMCLTIVSIYLTSFGILEPVVNALHITDYLNPFNWIGFFAAGILLQHFDHQTLLCWIQRTRVVSVIACIFLTVLIALYNCQVGYFSYYGWMYELIAAWSIFGLCTFETLHHKTLVRISHVSYAIYLLHMMLIGFLETLCNTNLVLSVFTNVVILATTYLILRIGQWIAAILKLDRCYNFVIGNRGSL